MKKIKYSIMVLILSIELFLTSCSSVNIPLLLSGIGLGSFAVYEVGSVIQRGKVIKETESALYVEMIDLFKNNSIENEGYFLELYTRYLSQFGPNTKWYNEEHYETIVEIRKNINQKFSNEN